jgi:NAD(P)H-dependent FMN reductase
MPKVLVVIGSAREGRVADKIKDYVVSEIDKHDNLEVTVADLKELALPFFESPTAPANPDYVITDEHVAKWQDLIQANDTIVFLTPEYNHGVSPIQKNAIDSLGPDWNSKKVTIVAYNWGTSFALDSIRVSLEFLKAEVQEPIAHLAFMKDVAVDGSLIEGGSALAQIAATVDAIAA